MKLRNIAAYAAAVVMAGALSSCVKTYDYTKDCKKGKEMLEYLVPCVYDLDASRDIVVVVNDRIIMPNTAKALVEDAVKGQHERARNAKADANSWGHNRAVEISYSISQWEADAKLKLEKALASMAKWNQPGIRFVERSRMEEVMKEHHFQLSDWADENKTAQIGKALNADYVLTCTSSTLEYDYDSIDISEMNLNFFSINTLETVITPATDWEHFYENSVDHQRKKNVLLKNLSQGIGEGNTDAGGIPVSPKMAGLVSVKKSPVKYAGEYSSYVCPFVKEGEKVSDTVMEKLDALIFSEDRKKCTVVMKDGSKETGRMKFKSQEPLELDVLVATKQVSLPANSRKELISSSVVLREDIFDLFYSDYKGGEVCKVYLTDKKIGEISINTPSLELEGAVFRDGDQLVIDYKADKKDGTGYHYFAFFTVEDEDDDWD